jgi:hypothetical protein
MRTTVKKGQRDYEKKKRKMHLEVRITVILGQI